MTGLPIGAAHRSEKINRESSLSPTLWSVGAWIRWVRLALRRLATSKIADLSGWIDGFAARRLCHGSTNSLLSLESCDMRRSWGERHKKQPGNNEESDRERRRLDEDFAVRKGPGESPLRPV